MNGACKQGIHSLPFQFISILYYYTDKHKFLQKEISSVTKSLCKGREIGPKRKSNFSPGTFTSITKLTQP